MVKKALPLLLIPQNLLAGTCAMCRQSLESGGTGGLLEGFYWSILLIGSIPLMVLSFLGWRVWQSYRKSSPDQPLS